MSEKNKPASYVRRRGFNKINVKSWLIYLERDGFVRCSFKDCNFMAFDVEEMRNHFGLCNGGDSSNTAQYVCGKCDGQAASLKKLQLHQARAHDISFSETSDEEIKPEEEQPVKPSRLLEVSWGCFLDKNNYIKCSSCNYLANTLLDMGHHYIRCKQEMEMLLYVCPECKGRTKNVNSLLWHMERSHKIFKAPSQFNNLTINMVHLWKRELIENGQASCLHTKKGIRDCFYFDFDILEIIEHSQICKGPKVLMMEEEQCLFCPRWTNSADKLDRHVTLCHPDKLTVLEGRPVTIVSVKESDEEDEVLALGDCDRSDSDETSCQSGTSGERSPRQVFSTAPDWLEIDEVSGDIEDQPLLLRLISNHFQEIEVATLENRNALINVAVQQEERTENREVSKTRRKKR